MPSQQAEVLETIAALKRKLRRDQNPAIDEPITSATNRGNKLKQGANNVHAGALPYPHGPNGLKEQVNHAGYNRYIIARNPKRYNEYGYELEDEESDAEADADAEEENPYSGVHIEELLRPLTHPSELATHPTLSIPFRDPALPNMVENLQEQLHHERANLWRAKALHRQLLGDENWIPSGAVETQSDWDLFQPRPKRLEERSRKRKREDELLPLQNGVTHDNHSTETLTQSVGAAKDGPRKSGQPGGLPQDSEDALPLANSDDTKDTAAEDIEMEGQETITNGIVEDDEEKANDDADDRNGVQTNRNNPPTSKEQRDGDPDNAYDHSGSGSPDPPTRRITRALAAEADGPTLPLSPSLSESTVDSYLLTVDPLFLLPPQLSTNHRMPAMLQQIQLPVDESIETRRLLFVYIQKQEESVRGLENILAKLIKAKRLKDQLWEACKAEGHVGELSDGEDWIDAEAWDEKPGDLKKGKDEEDENKEEEGRKGKRRRARDRERE